MKGVGWSAFAILALTVSGLASLELVENIDTYASFIGLALIQRGTQGVG